MGKSNSRQARTGLWAGVVDVVCVLDLTVRCYSNTQRIRPSSLTPALLRLTPGCGKPVVAGKGIPHLVETRADQQSLGCGGRTVSR